MKDRGDDPTLAALLANRRAFLRFLERRLPDRPTAEDVLQDVFARAVAARGALRDHESAVAWFYRMLRNAVVDRYRRGDASRRALEAFARAVLPPAPGPEVLREVCACVGRVAGTLKPEYAQAVREVDVEGVPVKDFARRHGITPGNAAVRVHRARQALRRQVVASCGACAAHGCRDCTCRRPSAAPAG